jgi:hypothetical protein
MRLGDEKCIQNFSEHTERKRPPLSPKRGWEDNTEINLRKLLCKCKVKVKFSLCLTKHHAMKAYWESGDIAPRIL